MKTKAKHTPDDDENIILDIDPASAYEENGDEQ